MSSIHRLASSLDPLWYEIALLFAWARERELWLLLAVGLALWSSAYQVPYSYRLEFGGDRVTQRRHDDEPFINRLEGWNQDPEPQGDSWLDPSTPPPFR